MPAFQPVSPRIALAESREKDEQYVRVPKESMNMFKLQCARMRRAAGPVLAVFLAATLHAQTSIAGQSSSAAIDALLAKAGTMYYSTTKAGLTGFDCVSSLI
jgi:hypothetical protein